MDCEAPGGRYSADVARGAQELIEYFYIPGVCVSARFSIWFAYKLVYRNARVVMETLLVSYISSDVSYLTGIGLGWDWGFPEPEPERQVKCLSFFFPVRTYESYKANEGRVDYPP